tara:strand:- start:871 stop:1212 length:342 start_codon:yes stop_codon:yes gene_type:complete
MRAWLTPRESKKRLMSTGCSPANPIFSEVTVGVSSEYGQSAGSAVFADAMLTQQKERNNSGILRGIKSDIMACYPVIEGLKVYQAIGSLCFFSVNRQKCLFSEDMQRSGRLYG